MKELLYRKIADGIKKNIANGSLPGGSRLPGVRELAAEWNTSANTVLKALVELESAGLIRKTRGQGIFVEEQSLWKKTEEAVRSLELVLYDLNVPFNRQLVSSIESAAADFGYSLVVKTSSAPDDMPLPEYGGRIIVPSSVERADTDTAKYASEAGAALIYIGEFSPPQEMGVSYAVIDSYGGFFRAAEYLLEGGRERIAYIGASENIEDEAGWNACRDVLSGSRNGFGRKYSVSAGGWDAEAGRSAMENLLLGGEFPDGLICRNNTLAAGALKACRAAGLSVPDDIAVIGAGDQDIASLLDPPLTSLKMPADILGLTAVGYIDSVLRGRTGIAGLLRARLDMEMIIRESAPSVEDDSIWL